MNSQQRTQKPAIQRSAFSIQRSNSRRGFLPSPIGRGAAGEGADRPLTTDHRPLTDAAQRRGVLLLVILSLLFMFVLIAVTYVLVATRHLAVARQYSRAARTGGSAGAASGQKQLDDAMLQVVRGDAPTIDATTGVEHYHSPIGPHSLLEDLYGTTVKFKISANAAPTANGQLFEITAVADGSFPPRVDNGFYAGLVLTMTSGPAKGLSSRIVYSQGVGTTTVTFRVLPFRGSTPITSLTYNASNPDKFIVNGRPFSGSGFGFNRATGRLDAMFDLNNSSSDKNSIPWAFLPNPLSYDPSGLTYFYANVANGSDDYLQWNSYAPDSIYSDFSPNNIPPFGGPGGANEDYDAPDYQNMAMAYVPPSPTGSNPIIPSFHRPELVRYFANFANSGTPAIQQIWTTAATNQRLRRMIMLRPMGKTIITPPGAGSPTLYDTSSNVDHPNFTGSNVGPGSNPGYFDPINGPWDVDNDGDGVADSVWLDLGMPVQSAADGKLYKPLFAILCVDLDGRINVNASGNAAQTQTGFTGEVILPSATSGGPLLAGGAGGTLPVGAGFGPADINPGALAGGDVQLVQRLLWGSAPYEGRYGNSPGTGTLTSPEVGAPGTDDPKSALHFFQYPPLAVTSFGTPADVWGRRVVGLDFRGQPIVDAPVTPSDSKHYPALSSDSNYNSYFTNETSDDPYEIDLSLHGPRPGAGASATTTIDNPFTVYELEQILRPYDVDSQGLAGRLEELIKPNLASFPALLKQLTTESFDLPVPSVVVPVELRDPSATPNTYLDSQHKQAFHVKDLLLAKLSAAGVTGPTAETEVDKMLAWELRAGGRMNIDRPLGDGRDSDGANYSQTGGTAYLADEPTTNELKREGMTAASGAANVSVWASPQAQGGFNADISFELDNGVISATLSSSHPAWSKDWDGDGTPGTATDKLMLRQLMTRQLMARHLYVLMLLLHNSSFDATWTPLPPEDTDPSLTPALKQELTARKIAQWSVNVVDFMDPDSIMTPFEYDLNPWNGWQVDGIIDDGSGALSVDDAGQPNRRLVWGCEAPALLLTETLAFHDRRVADTPASQKRGSPGDSNLDQVLIPQGSAFFELYSVANANASVQAGDLYTYQGTKWYLDLGRMAPPGNDGLNAAVSYPVWRLAISAPHLQAASARNYAQAHPETVSFQPQQGLPTGHPLIAQSTMSELNAPGNRLDTPVERIVWFGSTQPATGLRDGTSVEIYYGHQYFNSPVANSALLLGGSYAVIGPRPITPIGSKSSTTSPYWGVPSGQQICLDPTKGPLVGGAGTNYPTTSVQPVLGIVCQADPPSTSWTGPPVGISISEPMPSTTGYYLQPINDNPSNPNGGTYKHEAYVDVTDNTTAAGAIDTPLEQKSGTPRYPVEQFVPSHTDTATTLNHRTVFLQRLANPLASYHPLTNPYLTVDWMPIDLTVFNGEDRQPTSWNSTISGAWDPDDANADYGTANKVAFACRQRGAFSSFNPSPTSVTDNSGYNIWSQWPNPVAPALNLGGENAAYNSTSTTVPPSPSPNFPYLLNHDPTDSRTDASGNRGTLGYLNHGYGAPLTSADAEVSSGGASIGDPRRPFPWITWNNRPYAGVYELLQVPASSPARLTWEASIVDRSVATPNPYNEAPTSALYAKFPFRHLLNFLASGSQAGNEYANFCRVLDYLEVPSPFVGTEMVLNPADMGSGTTGTDYLHPPFCTVSEFRDPGRVNINTVASTEVWQAVVGPGGLNFAQLQLSREGRAASTTAADYPTEFANPFRSYSAGDMVPRIVAGGDVDALRRRPANAGLLRAARQINDGNLTAAAGDPDDDPNTKLPALMNPTTVAATPPQYEDGTRNSYFMYQGLDRISNLVTTHSNVYAIWVTVGYFEVTPWYGPSASPTVVYDVAHPDGYQLGQELGSDTGNITRHRGFYIIDRSIPVGYERGQNHNVENTILLRRFIE